MKKEKLVSVEIWDLRNNNWQCYDCPRCDTVEDYIDWCIGEHSEFWATVNSPEDKIRLNGKYIIDGEDHFVFTLKK